MRSLLALRRHGAVLVAYAIALVLFLVAVVHTPSFASLANGATLLTSATLFALPALGQTLVVLVGGIDLSIPWVMTAAALLTSKFALILGLPTPLVVVGVLLVAGVVGAANGIGVTYFGVPPIAMTLAMGGLVSGYVLAPGVFSGKGSGNSPADLTALVGAAVGPVPVVFIAMVVVAVIVGVVLHRGRFGRQLYATGLNDVVARLAGLRIRRIRIATYVVSSMAAALGGILLLGYAGQAYLSMGQPYLFASIAAAAIGGVSLLGGSGTYWGAFGGALALTLLTAILPLFQLGFGAMQILYGIVILIGIIVGRLLGTGSERQGRDSAPVGVETKAAPVPSVEGAAPPAVGRGADRA